MFSRKFSRSIPPPEKSQNYAFDAMNTSANVSQGRNTTSVGGSMESGFIFTRDQNNIEMSP
ncbi:hypothetical protein [Enterobacter ludwigii]|uniref:hypothetical protein n=1 Tax=Enterobacter ludwigii TaxID=299767 RepID=UPI002FF69E78